MGCGGASAACHRPHPPARTRSPHMNGRTERAKIAGPSLANALVWCAAAVAAGSMTPAAHAQNMLLNGSFEWYALPGGGGFEALGKYPMVGPDPFTIQPWNVPAGGVAN